MRHPTAEDEPQVTLVISTDPPKARPAALHRAMTIAQAFARIAGGCLDHVIAAAAYAQGSNDPEGVHQARVAIRRLRAAFSVFRPVLPRRKPAIIRRLRMLQRRLGATRELDVLIEETIASMPMRSRMGRGMRDLLRLTQNRRDGSRRRARTALSSAQCVALRSELAPSIDRYLAMGLASRATATRLGEPIEVFAADVLGRRWRKVKGLGARLGELDEIGLHALRIEVKKLRYAAEFFRDLWPQERTQRYLALLKSLQQLLGTAHDAAVAVTLIADLGKQGGTHAERAASLVQSWAKACFGRDRRNLTAQWQRCAKVNGFWEAPRGHWKRPIRHTPELAGSARFTPHAL